MLLKVKKRTSELIDTISEMLEVLCGLSSPANAVSDCLMATEAIFDQLSQEETIPQNTMKQLQIVQKGFIEYLNDVTKINEESVKSLNEQVINLKKDFHREVREKLKVVFFPYKVSMWDSLASVYENASNDKDCIAHVVPIPYYQFSQNKAIPTYEGEQFPQNVPITHYSEYNLELEEPDIIFVHNIYDNNNTLTCVYEDYFTSNLKRYTEMLVYVPYYTASFIPYKKGEGFYPYNLPSIKNIDKIILVNNSEKEIAIREGISEDKILVLGSPKLDAMVNSLNNHQNYYTSWRDKIDGKMVYLLNTGCLYFASNPFLALENLISFFNIPRFTKNSVVIWRPHPLTKTSIMRYTPFFLNYFTNLIEKLKVNEKYYNGIIFDESDDYLPALMAADVLISADSSLLRSYLLTEKKVIYLADDLPKDSLIPSNAFYYAYNQNEPWYEVVKKFSNSYDPLAENRKGIAANVYANTDGTSGEKIYNTVKKQLLLE